MGLSAAVTNRLVVAGALTLFSALRRTRNRSNLLETEKPPPLVERGSAVPLVLGVERLSGMLIWEEPDRVEFEDLSGGAGGKGIGSAPGGLNEVIYSYGQHLICVGPGSRLTRIAQDGKTIWPKRGEFPEGITPATAPSGTSFDCRNADNGASEGSFRIYWGEIDQPVDALLSGTKKGAATNDGFSMHVVWDSKRLGGTRTWPTLEYDVHVQPYSPLMRYNSGTSWNPDVVSQAGTAQLPGSASWIEGYQVADESELSDIRGVTNGSTSTSVRVCEDKTAVYTPGTFADLRDTQVDGRYEVISSTFIPGGGTDPSDSLLSEIVAQYDIVTASANGNTNAVVHPTIDNGIIFPTAGAFPAFPGYGPVDNTFLVANRIDRYNGTDDLRIDFSANASGPYIPDGASTGKHLGRGTHQFTIYLWKENFETFDFKMGFSVGGTDYYAQIRRVADGTIVDLGVSGSEISFTHDHIGGGIGSDYVQLKVRFRVPSNKVGDQYTQFLQLEDLSDNGSYSFKYLACADTPQTSPFFGHTVIAYCDAGVTEVELSAVPGTLIAYQGQIVPITLNSKVVAGANLAHVINQIFTTPAPHGIGDFSSVIDAGSLEALGALFASENYRTHYWVAQGNRHSNILERALYEALVNVQWDPIDGRWMFKAVRTGPADFKIDENMVLADTSITKDGRSPDAAPRTMFFEFRNMERNLTADPISFSEDGNSTDSLGDSTQKVKIDSARDYETANALASRLYLLESSIPSVWNLSLSGDKDVLRVGDKLDMDSLLGISQPLLVQGLKPNPLEPGMEVSLASTPFTEQSITLAATLQNPPARSTAPTKDIAQGTFLLSSYLSEDPLYLALRIPNTTGSTKSQLYFSRDGVGYQSAGTVKGVTGGVVASNFVESATVPDSLGQFDFVGGPESIEANGPVIRVFDPNFTKRIRTLSDAELLAGDQWLIINGTAQKEVMFVKRFEPLGGDLWQAKDVIRGRFDHGVSDLEVGVDAFVVQASDLPSIAVDVAATDTAYLKMVEFSADQTIPIADVEALALESPSGVLKPPHVESAEVFSPASGKWISNQDLILVWGFANSRAMKHIRYSGLPLQGTDPFDGKFVVELWSSDAEPYINLLSRDGEVDGTVTITGTAIANARTANGLSAAGPIRARIRAFSHAGIEADTPDDTVIEYEIT